MKVGIVVVGALVAGALVTTLTDRTSATATSPATTAGQLAQPDPPGGFRGCAVAAAPR